MTDNNHKFHISEVAEETPVDLPHDYRIRLKNDEELFAKGFLAVAQTFAAVGNKQGDVSIVVPLDEIRVITEIERPSGNA